MKSEPLSKLRIVDIRRFVGQVEQLQADPL
jgi:hypothetical protein